MNYDNLCYCELQLVRLSICQNGDMFVGIPTSLVLSYSSIIFSTDVFECLHVNSCMW